MAKDVRFAVIGGGFMGKAYAAALASLPIYCSPPPAMPLRELMVEADEGLAAAAQERYGFRRASADWRAAVADPEIDAVCVLLPNHLHREVVTEVLAAGKHVICEKPLAPTVDECRQMLDLARRAGVVHQAGFNWRLTPAVQMARKLIQDGAIGEVRHFRGFFHCDFGGPGLPMAWRFQRATAGAGVLGDMGSHIVDWARFLVGEVDAVVGHTRTYVPERQGPDGALHPVDVDDDSAFLLRFAGGAMGFIHASWAAPGGKTGAGFEIHGSEGALRFEWERMSELWHYSANDPVDQQGFKRIVIGPDHPDGEHFWPIPGYQISYADTKVVQVLDFLSAVAGQRDVSTSFADGLRVAEIQAAVQRSWDEAGWVDVERSDVPAAASEAAGR